MSDTLDPKVATVAPGDAWEILLVDDHAMVREALLHLLERLDSTLKVKLARDFEEALGRLRDGERPSLLLLDYHMPGMSGSNSIKTIKQEFPELKIGIISGFLSAEEVEPLIAAGAVGVFPKTMSGPSLLMALKLSLSGQIYAPWSGDLSQHGLTKVAPAANPVIAELTERQKEVLKYIVAGAPNKEIAQHLGISEVTVKIHVAALCRKFDTTNRTQLAMAATRAGIDRGTSELGT